MKPAITTITRHGLKFERLTPQDMIDLSERAYDWLKRDIIDSGFDVAERLDRLAEQRGYVSQLLRFINSLFGTWEVISLGAKRAGTKEADVMGLGLTTIQAINLAGDIAGFPSADSSGESEEDNDGAPRPPVMVGGSTG